MAEHEDEAGLAGRLKGLRERSWPSVKLTQEQLARIFSSEVKVSGATISAWESTTNPKRPTAARLEAYARFFAARRLLDGEPHLIPKTDLTLEERSRCEGLEAELLGLLGPSTSAPFIAGATEIATKVAAEIATKVAAEIATKVAAEIATKVTTKASAGAVGATKLGQTFTFKEGPVTVICPKTPAEARGPLAREKDANFTKLQQYGDLDALIEMYGHLRAANPTLDVYHRHAGDVGFDSDYLSSHVIVLGGITWNEVTKRFQDSIRQVPIIQIDVPEYSDGDIFKIAEGYDQVGEKVDSNSDGEANSRRFYPSWEGNVVVEDIAFIARLPNPFNGQRTLTICNGVHSRGVYGAVRCLTDRRVRDANEQYLAERFPNGVFALLLRVPVVANETTMSPDFTNPTARLYEWPALLSEQG